MTRSPRVAIAALRAPVVTGLVLTLAAVGPAWAQGRASPHETVKATVDGATISVSYGRPYMKGRTIMGDLVPFGLLWRLGADEATTITTSRDLLFGSYRLKAGGYSLFAVPGKSAWKLLVNAETGQSGLEHDASKDLTTIEAKPGTLAAPVEQLTLAIVDTPAGGHLSIRWERTEVVVPFTVAK